MERYILVDTLKQHPLELANFPEAQDDDELVRIAVKKNGLALQFASVRLQGDFETVLLAVKKNGASLEFASDILKANSEIALAAVKSDGVAYAYISKELQNDLQFVIEATRTTDEIIKLIPEKFLSNKDVAWNLIKQDPCLIGWFQEGELRKDLDLLKAAAKANSDACMYMAEEIWSDKAIVVELVSIDAYIVTYSSIMDKDIALAAMKGINSSWAFRELPKELQEDPDVLRAYVANLDIDAREGYLWNIKISDELLKDDSFITNIVNYCAECEECPYDESECIWKNESFRARAMEVSGYCLDTCSGFIDWTEDEEDS